MLKFCVLYFDEIVNIRQQFFIFSIFREVVRSKVRHVLGETLKKKKKKKSEYVLETSMAPSFKQNIMYAFEFCEICFSTSRSI